MATKQKRAIRQTTDSFEDIKNIGNELKKSVVEDLGKGTISDLWEQILGKGQMAQSAPRSGDLKQGEEINLKQEKKIQNIEPGINYAREIVHAEKKINAENEQQTKVRIQEIMFEIKKLTSSSKELQIQFKEVTMEQVPQGAGKYHTAFMEWVLSLIRSARERVDSAVSWTSIMKSKKGQRQYWSLFKKHGTSFGLSGERVVATQAG